MKTLLFILLVLPLRAEDWRSALASMPFATNSFQAYQTPPVELILKSFRPTAEMRGVVLMPAAADQLYFFNSGPVQLAEKPSLLDALNGLTNKANLRYSFVPPFLFVHMDQDTVTDPLHRSSDVSAKFDKRRKRGKLYFLDRPYDKILTDLEWVTGLKSIPDAASAMSYHYYRLSFVGYDLSAADFLRAMAYGTKTTVTIDGKQARFADRPFLPVPKS